MTRCTPQAVVFAKELELATGADHAPSCFTHLMLLSHSISIGLNVPFPSDMRTMIKIHDHDISRRHPPASTQPVGTSIGDHQGVLYVHPFVPVAIPSPNSSSARARGKCPPSRFLLPI